MAYVYRKLAASLALLMLAGCGPSMEEQFQKAKAAGTADALDQFEEQYPDNPYAEELAQLREDVLFKEAQADGTPEALEAFLKEYEDGKHAEEAKALLDEARWAKATKEGRIKSYKAYLKAHPEGKHAAEAKKKVYEMLLDKLARPKTPIKRFRSYLKKKDLPPEYRDKAIGMLDERLKAKHADTGLIRFIKKKDGKRVYYRWVGGFAGGKVLEIQPKRVKLPKKGLVWKEGKKKVKGPKVKGKLALALLADELDKGPIQVVGVLKVKGRSYMASAPLKIKHKKLNKKKKGKAKFQLKWADVPEKEGKARLYILLVEGDEVPKKATELKPVSNILSFDTTVTIKRRK